MRKLLQSVLGLSFLLLCLTACKGSAHDSPPVIDISSPDRTVESLWAFQSWEAVKDAKEYANRQHVDYSAFAPEAQAKFKGQLQRSIERAGYQAKNRIRKVEQETSTRAVVHASETGWNDETEDITYLLTKTDKGWLIRDKTKVCWRCKGAGEVDDLDQKTADIEAGRYSTNPKKKCDICHGKGWISAIFD